MNETPPPVDAGGQAPPSESTPTPTDKGADYWKNEAHNAFEKRNAAKSRVKELEAELNALKKPDADADGEMSKQLATLITERDGLQTKLDETLKAHRESAIISKLTAGLPEDRHAAIVSLYRSFAARLDDGSAEPAEIAKEAGELLSKIAAPLFETKAVHKPGRLPNDGGPAKFDPEAEKAKHAAALKAMGATGISL
jgi:hypothetical protein